MDQATLDQVADILQHPFRGLRATDPQLARAALTGTLGRRRHLGTILASSHGSLTEGLREQGVVVHPRSVIERLRSYYRQLAIQSRRWYLRRAQQVDQGNTPWCVDATRCHWQLSLPVYGRLSHALGALYEECKKIDPWPGEDGTSAEYMLTVCQERGIVDSSWWYQGPQDADALLRWLTEVGGVWFGASWPEDAFRTRPDGVVEVRSDAQWLYGHETYLIGRQRNYRRMGPHIEGVQSWGRYNYGIDGRFFIPEQEFFDRWMHPDQGWGDAVGVVEKLAA